MRTSTLKLVPRRVEVLVVRKYHEQASGRPVLTPLSCGRLVVDETHGAHGTVAPTLNGTTLPMTLRQALRTGRVNRVPVIAGTDRDENLIGFRVTSADYVNLVHGLTTSNSREGSAWTSRARPPLY